MSTFDIPLHLNKILTSVVNESLASGEFLDRVNPVTAKLINFWFDEEFTSHRPINFYDNQKQAILNAIYLSEILSINGDFMAFYDEFDGEILQSLCYESMQERYEIISKEYPMYGYLEEKNAEIACGNFQNFLTEQKEYEDFKEACFSYDDYCESCDCLFYEPHLPASTNRSWTMIAFYVVKLLNVGIDGGAVDSYKYWIINRRIDDILLNQDLFIPNEYRERFFNDLTQPKTPKKDQALVDRLLKIKTIDEAIELESDMGKLESLFADHPEIYKDDHQKLVDMLAALI